MSGGVDSSAAALRLIRQGYDVCGATLLLTPESTSVDREVNDAAEACRALGIKHLVPDMKELFKAKVIDYFAEEYARGRTPNPCIVCNREIKLGAMLDYALENGFDAVATGHYAGIERQPDGQMALRRSRCSKDQSYVLWQLSQHQLAHAVFPLCDEEKSVLREEVRAAGIPCYAKPDSQDICFIPDGDYRRYLRERCGITDREGSFVDENGNVLGQHSGITGYTVGQRKGLGGGFPEPMFVAELRPVSNEILLCPGRKKLRSTVFCENINMIRKGCDSHFSTEVKLRYSAPMQQAEIDYDAAAGKAILRFEQPQPSPTPGQSAVFYSGEYVLGGGIITGSE